MADIAVLRGAQSKMKMLSTALREEYSSTEPQYVATAISTAALEQVYLLMREGGFSDEFISQTMVMAAVTAPMMFEGMAARSSLQ